VAHSIDRESGIDMINAGQFRHPGTRTENHA
jgi:hypothetical protein